MPPGVRRLVAADAPAFQAFWIERLRLDDASFRTALADEEAVPLADIVERLTRSYVVGEFDASKLIGMAGLSCANGAKLRHKGLLWGMYVRAGHRGSGVADRLMAALLDHARGEFAMVTLTVVASNARAIRFYERWGFTTYGVEPASVRLADGTELDEALMAYRFA